VSKSEEHKQLDSLLLGLISPCIQVGSGNMPPDFFAEVLESRQDEIHTLVASVRATEGEKGIKKARSYTVKFAFGQITQYCSRSTYDEFVGIVDSLLS
jgi:hypothetical protein